MSNMRHLRKATFQKWLVILVDYARLYNGMEVRDAEKPLGATFYEEPNDFYIFQDL